MLYLNKIYFPEISHTVINTTRKKSKKFIFPWSYPHILVEAYDPMAVWPPANQRRHLVHLPTLLCCLLGCPVALGNANWLLKM